MTSVQLKIILVKSCDISNELRPLEVSEPWLDCLLEEYFNQARKVLNTIVRWYHHCAFDLCMTCWPLPHLLTSASPTDLCLICWSMHYLFTSAWPIDLCMTYILTSAPVSAHFIVAKLCWWDADVHTSINGYHIISLHLILFYFN